jgi:hypothetical protein
LNPAGLQVILQMSGTVETLSHTVIATATKAQIPLVHAALNVLLRRSGPLPTK